MFATLLAYTVAALLLTVTPGADTLLVVRYAGGRGVRAGFAAAAGVCLGTLVWGAIVAIGVAALIVANPFLFELLKWAGAAYLVWLGMTLLLLRPDHAKAADGGTAGRLDHPFASGLLTNLLNPKVGLFYVAFLPQFIPPGVPQGPFILLLAAIHSLLGLIWFALIIAGADRAAGRLRHSRASSILARLTGILFVGFGARLLLDSR
ncbi:MAG TPA: LysE family translocator [Sphingomicrobium sp.]|nr:LysE family translocator [Sphingomicrobium sp.]